VLTLFAHVQIRLFLLVLDAVTDDAELEGPAARLAPDLHLNLE
jgi:hypothetical protein